MYQNLVLHIPHGSTWIPGAANAYTQKGYQQLVQNGRYLVDYHTTPLFHSFNINPQIHLFQAIHHRLLVDMERLPNDPLEEKGYGIVSKWAIEWLGEASRARWMSYYNGHHEHGASLLNALKDPLLIDCHSFSAHPTPLCQCPPDIDVCIGFNEDETKPPQEIIDLVASYFMDSGYSVGINQPFSNSKTFPGATDYHSLMIEINKRCYMDEETLHTTAGFIKLHKELQQLYHLLLKA